MKTGGWEDLGSEDRKSSEVPERDLGKKLYKLTTKRRYIEISSGNSFSRIGN